MVRHRGAIVRTCAVVVTAAALAACTKAGGDQSSPTPAGTSSTSQPSPAEVEAGIKKADDIVLAAIDRAAAAKTSTYRVESEINVGGLDADVQSEYVVDVKSRATSIRSNQHLSNGGEVTDSTTHIVQKADVAYYTQTDWTDARSGKWVKVTADDSEDLGLLELGRIPIVTIPSLGSFEADEPLNGSSDNVMRGTVAAVEGLNLFSLSGLMDDENFVRSLDGRIPVEVTLHPVTSALVQATVIGEGHTVTGSSSKLTEKQLSELVTGSRAEVLFKQFGEPVTIAVPKASEIYTP